MRSERFDVKDFTRCQQLNLDMIGFYPGKWSRKWFIQLYKAIVIFFSFFLSEAMLHYVFTNCNSLAKVSRTLMFVVEYSGFMSKYLSLMRNRENVLMLEQILADDILANVTKEELREIKRLLKPVSLKTNIFQLACVMAILSLGIIPLLTKPENGEKSYPLPCAFPFNPDCYYGFVYAGEFLSFFAGAWYSPMIDNYFVKLMAVGAAHYSILGDRIRNMHKAKQLDDEEIRKLLRECIIYQQTVMNYTSVLQKTFSGGTFVQFFCSGIVICLAGFQMLIVQIYSSEIISIFLYFSAMIIQLSVYCWHGQFVMDKKTIQPSKTWQKINQVSSKQLQSDDLSKACYETNWYEMSVPNRKMLITIMESSKKGTIIQAGGFFDLNFNSLTAILRSSYSYFAILRQVYNKSLTAHART